MFSTLLHPIALQREAHICCVTAVNPGFGGQKFIEYQVEKVRKLRQMCNDAGVNPWIEVDGGISGKNAYKVCIIPVLSSAACLQIAVRSWCCSCSAAFLVFILFDTDCLNKV